MGCLIRGIGMRPSFRLCSRLLVGSKLRPNGLLAIGAEFSKGISGARITGGRVADLGLESIGLMERLGKRGFDTIYDSDRKLCDVGTVLVSVYSSAVNTGAFSIGACDGVSMVGWKGVWMESAKLRLLLDF